MAYDTRPAAVSRRRHRPVELPNAPETSSITVPKGKPYEEERGPLVPLGVGLIVGAAVGAVAALLLAPAAGEETREWIADHAERVSDRTRSAWDDLADEFRYARKKAGRMRTRARWWMEDLRD